PCRTGRHCRSCRWGRRRPPGRRPPRPAPACRTSRPDRRPHPCSCDRPWTRLPARTWPCSTVRTRTVRLRRGCRSARRCRATVRRRRGRPRRGSAAQRPETYEIDGCSHALLEPDGYGAPSPRTSFVSRCRCENSTRVAALTRLTVPSGPSSGKPGGTARARRSPEPKRSGSRRVLAKAPGGSRRLRSRPDDYGMVVVVESSSGQLGFDGRSTAARSTASASSAVMWPSPLKSQTVRLHSWRPTADCSTPSASLAVSTQSSSKKLPQTRHSSVVVVTPQPGIATFEHASPASLHVSVVQASESSHERAVPVHEPPEHASLVVQNSPSSHGSVLARFSQALLVSLHASVVHGFASPQSRAGPATHAPLL